MPDNAQDFEALRQIVKKLASEVVSLKKELQAANYAIGDLRTDVANLKLAQIARGHAPD
jgi:hypothetical protein